MDVAGASDRAEGADLPSAAVADVDADRWQGRVMGLLAVVARSVVGHGGRYGEAIVRCLRTSGMIDGAGLLQKGEGAASSEIAAGGGVGVLGEGDGRRPAAAGLGKMMMEHHTGAPCSGGTLKNLHTQTSGRVRLSSLEIYILESDFQKYKERPPYSDFWRIGSFILKFPRV
ncbi:hypothetical protein ACLOJK_027136 [Asimina triloba]